MHFHKDLKFRLTRHGLIFKELTFNSARNMQKSEKKYILKNKICLKVFPKYSGMAVTSSLCRKCAATLSSLFDTRAIHWYPTSVAEGHTSGCRSTREVLTNAKGKVLRSIETSFARWISRSVQTMLFCRKVIKRNDSVTLQPVLSNGCELHARIIITLLMDLNSRQSKQLDAFLRLCSANLDVSVVRIWRFGHCHLHLEVWLPCGRELIPKQATDFCRFSVKCSQTTKWQKQIAFLGC